VKCSSKQMVWKWERLPLRARKETEVKHAQQQHLAGHWPNHCSKLSNAFNWLPDVAWCFLSYNVLERKLWTNICFIWFPWQSAHGWSFSLLILLNIWSKHNFGKSAKESGDIMNYLGMYPLDLYSNVLNAIVTNSYSVKLSCFLVVASN